MCEKNYENLGEELADIYENSGCNEEYIRDYLDFMIPDLLREAANLGYRYKVMKPEEIMRYRHELQNFVVSEGFFTPWTGIVEKWGMDNGVKVRFVFRPCCNNKYDIVFEW